MAIEEDNGTSVYVAVPISLLKVLNESIGSVAIRESVNCTLALWIRSEVQDNIAMQCSLLKAIPSCRHATSLEHTLHLHQNRPLAETQAAGSEGIDAG